MYRETIEHPASIPEDIKAFVDLESGNDRGRIYRLVPPNWKRPKTTKLEQATSTELVAALSSADGWARDTAHRLIWERQDQAAVEPLRKLLRSDAKPVTIVLTLYGLSGLDALTAADVLIGLHHADAHVREHSLRLAESLADKNPEVLDAMLAHIDDPSLRVRRQLTFSLGELSSPKAVAGLKQLIPEAAKDSVIRTAWFSSVHRQAANLASEMLADDSEAAFPLLLELSRQVAAQGDVSSVLSLLDRVLASSERTSRQSRMLEALGEGLRRRGQSLSGVAADNRASAALRTRLKETFAAAAEEAQGESRGLGGPEVGVRLLAFSDDDTALAVLPELLIPQTPPALQQAAVKSLSAHQPARVAEALLANWRGFGPALRRDVVDVLVQSEVGAKQLLAAVSNGSVKGAEIERDKKQLLLNHPREAVRDQARTVLETTAGNRKQIVEDYLAALSLEADAARGKEIYAKTCSVCHRVGKEGHAVGPDLVSRRTNHWTTC